MKILVRACVRACVLALFALAGCRPISQGEVAACVGDIEIVAPWVRATVPGAPTAGGFLTIRNTGREPDRLTTVSTPAAAEAQIHQMSMDSGMMRMRQLTTGLQIPAGGSVELAPGSYHLMLIDPKGQFVEGQTVPMRLTFAHAGSVDVGFPVSSIEGLSTGQGRHH